VNVGYRASIWVVATTAMGRMQVWASCGQSPMTGLEHLKLDSTKCLKPYRRQHPDPCPLLSAESGLSGRSNLHKVERLTR